MAVIARFRTRSRVRQVAMRAKKPLTLSRIVAAVKRDDYTGFCKACGATRGNCEPDAEHYPCDNCGQNEVSGAEQLLMELS